MVDKRKRYVSAKL